MVMVSFFMGRSVRHNVNTQHAPSAISISQQVIGHINIIAAAVRHFLLACRAIGLSGYWLVELDSMSKNTIPTESRFSIAGVICIDCVLQTLLLRSWCLPPICCCKSSFCTPSTAAAQLLPSTGGTVRGHVYVLFVNYILLWSFAVAVWECI